MQVIDQNVASPELLDVLQKERRRWQNSAGFIIYCLVCLLSHQPPDCPQVAPHDPSRSGALVHSALPVEPCSGLDDAPVTNTLRWVNINEAAFTWKKGASELCPETFAW